MMGYFVWLMQLYVQFEADFRLQLKLNNECREYEREKERRPFADILVIDVCVCGGSINVQTVVFQCI